MNKVLRVWASMVLLLQLLLLLSSTSVTESFAGLGSIRRGGVRLWAKKGESGKAKGFGVAKKEQSGNSSNVDDESSLGGSSSSSSGTPVLPSGNRAIEETDVDAIFKKYNIKDGEAAQERRVTKKEVEKKRQAGEEAPFGEAVLAGIPASAQGKIDNFLVTAVFLALGFVVLSGVAISVGALEVVFPGKFEIDPTLDKVLTDVLSPAFTPALGIFFLFSITFGLFKYAQVSSSATVYRE